MKAIKQYGWLLQLIGAALLIGLALFLEFGNGEGIVVPFIGAIIIISAGVRLVPFVKTQKNDLVKTINIIEITIDVAIGLALILVTLLADNGLGNLFGYLIGVYLMLRGAVHFFGVSEFKENSDLPLYIFHVAALIVGSYVFFSGDFSPAILIHIILFFSIVAGGYLTYTGYKGYRSYRYQKTLTMPDIKHKDDRVEKEVPDTAEITPEKEIEEPTQPQDHVS
ncbi:hypothetical protein KQ51_01420 [Candidatus Izimaplasma bacterium HR1]|jgi:uncharacterized membrane protein HdeD (DUF308 family)|uniref:hypothetical protein n=1 Tax=Candidatus Izimoplasma sp. HR1 TaxID=1541959 RepID=UPI0004F92B99|nr:hypothetical protein KQ51_01420 [Candidatus Izimaplasma bacterium HR1]